VSLVAGRLLGPYRILVPLGKGGMDEYTALAIPDWTVMLH
jgi:hypothetical protein